MAAPETTEGTGAPEGHAGLPQMDVGTFPSQIFWLVVTFGLLFLVLWRKTLPMIEGAIGQSPQPDRRRSGDGRSLPQRGAKRACRL